MDKLYYDLLLAKEGDSIANETIIKRYDKYIRFLIFQYDIADIVTCYDEVKRKILKAIKYKFLKKL